MLNEGLEVLGTDEYPIDGRCWYGVFQESTLKSVKFPSTLKRIELAAFEKCYNLKSIKFPEGLEKIGGFCFCRDDIETLIFPSSVKEIGVGAFTGC